jgi:hypothetical protein
MDNHFDGPNTVPTEQATPAATQPEAPKKQGYHFKVASLIIGLVLAGTGAYLVITRTADQRAEKAAAGKYSETVKATRTGIPFCTSDTGDTCTVAYEYEVDGKTYTKTFENLSGLDIINNADNVLRYDPSNPADAILPENTIDPDASIKKWQDGKVAKFGLGLLGLAALFVVDAFIGYYIDTFRRNMREKTHEIAEKPIEIKKKDEDNNNGGATGSTWA